MDEQTYTLIAKILSGEGSDADRRELEVWLAANPQHTAEYESLKALWSGADLLFAGPSFDAKAAWQTVAAQTVDAPAAATPTYEEELVAPRKARIIPMWLSGAIAAAAVVVLGIFVFRQFLSADTITVLADAGNQVVELPDHSKVTLKKGSTLSYASEFDGDERNVSLQGEAFFEVTKDPAHPFIIDAQSANVRVLGTSFDVKCTEAGAVVSVATGKVRMTQKSANVSVDLLPGDRGTLEKNKLSQSRHPADDQSYLYWSTGRLEFENKPLKEALEIISAATDTVIAADASISADLQFPVSVSSNHESVASILDQIKSQTGGKFQFTAENGGYRVSAAH